MAEQEEQKQASWNHGGNSSIGSNINNDQWNNNKNKQGNNNTNIQNPDLNDGGLSRFFTGFNMSQFDQSSIDHLLLLGNNDNKMEDSSPIRIMDVSELERVHNAEKAEQEEKEAKALQQLEEYLDQKVNVLIEIGKHHIDTMESYIESLILSKLSCKVIEQCSEKCRSQITSILQSIWTPALKQQLLQNMQVQLKNYMTEVAKVYDVGLTHIKEHTYEAQSMAGINAEKTKQLCHELLRLQGVDNDVVKDLSEQCDSEYEELKNAKEITDMVGKQMGVLNSFKDKHNSLDNAIDNLTSQYLEKKQVLQNHIQKSVNEVIQREYSMQYILKAKQQQQAMLYRQQQLQQLQSQQLTQQQQQLLMPSFLQPQKFNGQNGSNINANSDNIGSQNPFGFSNPWFGNQSNEDEQDKEQDRQEDQGDIFEDVEEEEKQEFDNDGDRDGEENDEENEDANDMNEFDAENESKEQQEQQQLQVDIANTAEEGQQGQTEESNENQQQQQSQQQQQDGIINDIIMDDDQQQEQQQLSGQQRVIGGDLQKLQEKLQSPDFLNLYESAYTQYQQQLQQVEQEKEGSNNKIDSNEIDQEQQQK